MKRNLHIFCIFLLWLLLSACGVMTTEKDNFLKYLQKYIESNSEINQLMLLIDDEENIPNLQEISQQISSFPLFEFDNLTARDAQYLSQLPSFNNPRSTLFVLIISASNQSLSRLSKPINFITQLFPSKRRARVLIMLDVKKSSSYNDLLRFMWSRKFLDVTVLELIQTDSKENSFIDLHRNVANQHYFFPFTNTFVEKKYSSKSELFPKKLWNLHGYTMKVGLFHYPPYVFFIRNSTGDVVDFEGFDMQVLNALSKALNFKVTKFISNKTTWDISSCQKEKNVGLYHRAIYNKFQLVGVHGSVSNLCLRKFMEVSSTTDSIYYVAVVPLFPEETSRLTTEWRFYNAMALFSLLILTWILTRLLRFDNQNWKMEYLMQIVLGFTIPHEPRVLAERIVLGSMLLSCLLHSSIIYTAFTSINLEREPPKEIETVEDLISSDLTPLLLPNFYSDLMQDSGEKNPLLKKTVVRKITDELCVEHLIAHKNVSCFIREYRAKWLIQKHRDGDGNPVMKIMKESILKFTEGYFMEAASPYANRFENVLTKFTESGLNIKWYEKFFGNHEATVSVTDTLIKDDGSNVQIRTHILFVLIFGYTCSLLVFFGEVIVYSCRKFFH